MIVLILQMARTASGRAGGKSALAVELQKLCFFGEHARCRESGENKVRKEWAKVRARATARRVAVRMAGYGWAMEKARGLRVRCGWRVARDVGRT